MARSIYEMRLHDKANFDCYCVLRVAGGWIYSSTVYQAAVFVPWNNEFQQANAPCTAEGANLYPPTPSACSLQCSAAYPSTGPTVIGGTAGVA